VVEVAKTAGNVVTGVAAVVGTVALAAIAAASGN
jgi:hypothetical protein